MAREFHDLQFVALNEEKTLWGLAKAANPWEEFMQARWEGMEARRQAYEMMRERNAAAWADYIWLAKLGGVVFLMLGVLLAFAASMGHTH